MPLASPSGVLSSKLRISPSAPPGSTDMSAFVSRLCCILAQSSGWTRMSASSSQGMNSWLRYLEAPILTQRRRKCTDQHAPSSDPPCATQRAGSHGRWYWRKRAGVTVQNDVKAIVPGVVPCDVAVASVGVREMVVVVAVVVIAPLMLRVQCIERGRRRAAAARPIRQT